MQNSSTYSTLFSKEKPKSKPKVAMFFVYLILGLSLCVFGASIWFSSYAKNVYLDRKPQFRTEADKIQHEIRKLELEENTLTNIERVHSLINELGLVEYTRKSIELWDK